jgi:hypothetical protein
MYVSLLGLAGLEAVESHEQRSAGKEIRLSRFVGREGDRSID